MGEYKKASIKPLSDTVYGIGFHWTTWNVMPDGSSVPFEQAVASFDVEKFAAQAVECGAGHVLFTLNPAVHHVPCPSKAVDKILPGRTCKRDLIAELAVALKAAGIKLILYYNHGTLPLQDPEWSNAMGLNDSNIMSARPAGYYDDYCAVITELGERYGEDVIAFWFDSGDCFHQDPACPWNRMTAAAKAGNPNRLVTYNTSIEQRTSFTEYQDYWAGEICRLNYLPREDTTPAGDPLYSFTSWHFDIDHYGCGEWGLYKSNYSLPWPAPCVDSVAAYLQRFTERGAAVTFNLLCYQDGKALESDLQVMRQIKKLVRK